MRVLDPSKVSCPRSGSATVQWVFLYERFDPSLCSACPGFPMYLLCGSVVFFLEDRLGMESLGGNDPIKFQT